MLRVTLSALTKGIPPLLAVEYGRRSIPAFARPSFSEVEKTCRNRGEAQPQAA
jgi:chemotaxis protein MotA